MENRILVPNFHASSLLTTCRSHILHHLLANGQRYQFKVIEIQNINEKSLRKIRISRDVIHKMNDFIDRLFCVFYIKLE